jgi:hypothetical protein
VVFVFWDVVGTVSQPAFAIFSITFSRESGVTAKRALRQGFAGVFRRTTAHGCVANFFLVRTLLILKSRGREVQTPVNPHRNLGLNLLSRPPYSIVKELALLNYLRSREGRGKKRSPPRFHHRFTLLVIGFGDFHNLFIRVKDQLAWNGY